MTFEESDIVRDLAIAREKLSAVALVLARRHGAVHLLVHRAAQVLRALDRLSADLDEHDSRRS